MQQRSNTRIYLAALALFVGGLGYLIYAGLNAGSAYHLDVREALTMPPEKLKGVRIFGTVAESGVVRGNNSLGVVFTLLDQLQPDKSLRVVYKGAVPDGFKPGVELYAEGDYAAGGKVLEARGLTTNCPSKYKKENRN